MQMDRKKNGRNIISEKMKLVMIGILLLLMGCGVFWAIEPLAERIVEDVVEAEEEKALENPRKI